MLSCLNKLISRLFGQQGLAMGGVLALILTGCKGIPQPGERQARQQIQKVTAIYQTPKPALSAASLHTNSSLSDLLRFAMLHQPRVEAAYQDWVASVERITTERSLPDPRLTFEMDITRVVEAVMPGLMMDFPGPGKLKTQAAVATAESQVRYHDFEASVLQTAFDLKKAYYQLYFLTEKLRVNQKTLILLSDIEQIARKQNEVGKVTLQDVLRAQIEQDRLGTDLANLEDSRLPLQAQFKAAMGLGPDQPDPPMPGRFETTPLTNSPEQLLSIAYTRNPRLKSMEAEVRRAEASIRLARKGRVPDFSLGLEADVKASPVMYRPQAGVTLPIWRDKIAAQIAEAQAGKSAAQARLSAEQIALAVEMAGTSYMLRESDRNLNLVRESLLPKARQSLEVARAAYLTGRTDFLNLIDAQRTLLDFELMEIEAQIQHEIALAELSLIIAGLPPRQAPLLPETTP